MNCNMQTNISNVAFDGRVDKHLGGLCSKVLNQAHGHVPNLCINHLHVSVNNTGADFFTHQALLSPE